jgi:hypothetical protein
MPIIDVERITRYIWAMKKVWDRAGIAFSSACVVHCIGVAFLPLFFPILETYTHSSWVHIIVGGLILLTSPLAFIPGYKKHGLTWIIGLAIIGLIFVLSGVLLENHVSDKVSHATSIFGSVLLVLAHAKNLQHSQRHQHQCC